MGSHRPRPEHDAVDLDDDLSIPIPAGARVHSLGPDLALIELPPPEAIVPATLTEAERDVALRVFDGATNDEIARARGVSLKTVVNQIDAIYRKLGVMSRAELVLTLKTGSGG